MPTPNYQFEKRRRDLAKKAKKDEKRRRKQSGDTRPADENPGEPPASTGTV